LRLRSPALQARTQTQTTEVLLAWRFMSRITVPDQSFFTCAQRMVAPKISSAAITPAGNMNQRPDFSWQRLREESPGLYESYVDLQPGVWTKMRIVVSGTEARLYVNGATQPCLLVNDLKLGATHGQIALWAYGGTDAYFSNLKVY
jgi:hypothetical protein